MSFVVIKPEVEPVLEQALEVEDGDGGVYSEVSSKDGIEADKGESLLKRRKKKRRKAKDSGKKENYASVSMLKLLEEQFQTVQKEAKWQSERLKFMEKEILVKVPNLESLTEEVGQFRSELEKEREERIARENQFQEEAKLQAGLLQNVEEVLLAEVPLLGNVTEDIGSIRKELSMDREEGKEMQKQFQQDSLLLKDKLNQLEEIEIVSRLESLSKEVGVVRSELGKQLEGIMGSVNQLQTESETHAARLKNVEDVILEKVPLLESVAKDTSDFRIELVMATEAREDDMKHFMECIQSLMHEIVQVNLKLGLLEERIAETEKSSPMPVSEQLSNHSMMEGVQDKMSTEGHASTFPTTPASLQIKSTLDNHDDAEGEDDDDLFERVAIRVHSPRTGKRKDLHDSSTLSSCKRKSSEFACLCGEIFNKRKVEKIEEHSLKSCKVTKNFSLEVFQEPGYKKKLCKVGEIQLPESVPIPWSMRSVERAYAPVPMEQRREHGRDAICRLSCLCGIQCCNTAALDNHLNYFDRSPDEIETGPVRASLVNPVEETSENNVSYPRFQLSSIGHRLINQANQHKPATETASTTNKNDNAPEISSKPTATQTASVAAGPICFKTPVPTTGTQVEAQRNETTTPQSVHSLSIESLVTERPLNNILKKNVASTCGILIPDPQPASTTITTNTICSIMSTSESPSTPTEWSPLPPAITSSTLPSITMPPPSLTTTSSHSVFPSPGPFFVQIDPATGKLRMVELEQDLIQKLPPTGTISMPLLGSLPDPVSLASSGIVGANNSSTTLVIPHSLGGIPPPPPLPISIVTGWRPPAKPQRILPSPPNIGGVGNTAATGYLVRPTGSSTVTVAPTVPLQPSISGTSNTSTRTSAILTTSNGTNVQVVRKTFKKNSAPVVLVFRKKGSSTTTTKAGKVTSTAPSFEVVTPPQRTISTTTSEMIGAPRLTSSKQNGTHPRCPCDSAKSPCVNCICVGGSKNPVHVAHDVLKKSLFRPTIQPQSESVSAPINIPMTSSVVFGDKHIPSTSINLISTTSTPIMMTSTTITTPASAVPTSNNGLVQAGDLRKNPTPLQNIQIGPPPLPLRTDLSKFTFTIPKRPVTSGGQTTPIEGTPTMPLSNMVGLSHPLGGLPGLPQKRVADFGKPQNVITIPLQRRRKQSFPPNPIQAEESQAMTIQFPNSIPAVTTAAIDQMHLPRKVAADGDTETITHQKAASAGHYLPFLCVCGMEFPSEIGLSEHIAQKTVEEFVGTGSSLLPSKKSRLSPNDNRHGRDPSRPLLCLCGKEYRTRHSLDWHIKIHTLEKAFICKTCGKGFVYGCLLNYHLRDAHKTGPRYKADQRLIPSGKCGDTLNGPEKGADVEIPLKSPSTKSHEPTTPTTLSTNYIRQEPPHPGIKKSKKKKKKNRIKFKPSSTSSGSNLANTNLRKQKRHGRDPWKRLHCLCGLKFANNVTLYDHVRYFAGRSLLSCKPCGRQFVYASQLKVHSHQVHKANFRLGSSCWKHFSNAKRLENYRKRKQLLTGATREFLCEIKREIEENDEYLEEDLDVPGNSINLHPPPTPSEPRYCSCNQISYGKMIACDNKKCPIEWYHYDCVGVISEPEGKWYCPNCKDNLESGD